MALRPPKRDFPLLKHKFPHTSLFLEGMSTPLWYHDILGSDFQCTDIELGADPDGEGTVEATLVRYRPESSSSIDTRPALLAVHGMTDYFFQRHVAEHFHSQGYAFYALDLRKCGRARMAQQRWHYVSDLAYYFEDLNASLDILSTTHSRVVPLGHSTGGLITAHWLDHLHKTDPHRHKMVPGLLFNSPWLDMMLPDTAVKLLRPAFKLIGNAFPTLPLPPGGLTTYGESIHCEYRGEWDFDLEMKPIDGHKKYFGWVAAILDAQQAIHEGRIDTGVPVLSLCSNTTRLGRPYCEEMDTADTIVDVADIKKWGPTLSDNARVHPIQGARHDVFLSLPAARQEAFRVADGWLRSLLK